MRRISLRCRYLAILVLTAIVVGLVVQEVGQKLADVQNGAATTINDFYSQHGAVRTLKDAIEEADRAVFTDTLGTDVSGTDKIVQSLSRIVGEIGKNRALCEDGHFAGLCEALSLQADQLRATRHFSENAEAVGKLKTLAHLFERRFYDAIVDNIFTALQASRLISNYLWGVAAICLAVMMAGFAVFEYAIRRPILMIARAMEGEGNGLQPFQSLSLARGRELAILIHAFEGMRAQVRSRQLRLQSVLDSTGDGIVTLLDSGAIESMNRAAEILCGCGERDATGRTLEEVLGCRPLSWPPFLDGESILDLQTPDGAGRQISLKYSRFQIDGARRYTLMLADVTERQVMISQLTTAAERDVLTGLYNRRYFFQELERIYEQAQRNPFLRVALLFIDLDHFKFVNDTFGHQAGDDLLVEIAQALKAKVRKNDLLARLGGDEFAIVLLDVDDIAAEDTAERFRNQIAGHSFHYTGHSVDVGCSIGVSLLTPTVRSVEDLVAQADLSCRHAKKQGRNRYHLYRDDGHEGFEELTADMGVTGQVRLVLAENKLRLAFQPIVALKTGAVVAHEVLSRIETVSGQPLASAGPLIAAAERVGAAFDIDRWVWRTLFAAMAKDCVPMPGARLSVNLSGQTIGTPGLLEEIESALREFSIDPRLLIFELTETTLIGNTANARSVLEGLKALGCQTALDDFGSGYCSFLYLKELPVDIVKLDGTLVRTIDRVPVNFALVRAMHDMAHALGKSTVAEFVETPSVRRHLEMIGVECGQGYHFGMAELFSSAAVPTGRPVEPWPAASFTPASGVSAF